jgi:hypothetical protein
MAVTLLLAGCASVGTEPTQAAPAATGPTSSPSSLYQGDLPDARFDVAMAYDAARRVTVLFGGNPGNGHLFTDTWTWDGSRWTKQHPKLNPSLRTPGMAYDAARQHIVLFGTPLQLGETASVPAGEAWTWDGQNWQKEASGTTPSARYQPRMTYDTSRNVVILFGGRGRPNEFFSDTWAWDGVSWTQLSATIPGLGDGGTIGAMAYSPTASRVVLYEFPGGNPSDRHLWLFDGSVWTQRPVTTTAMPEDGFGIVYADALHKLVLFGGEDAAIPPSTRSVKSDMWLWDGVTWTRQQTALAPAPRVYMGMVYDTNQQQILIFGGITSINGQDVPLNDTWTWDGTSWARRT